MTAIEINNPKQKAKKIFDKFAFEKTAKGYKMFQNSNESKRCALIAVTEIINAIAFHFETPIENTIYWLKVKQEIEKL